MQTLNYWDLSEFIPVVDTSLMVWLTSGSETLLGNWLDQSGAGNDGLVAGSGKTLLHPSGVFGNSMNFIPTGYVQFPSTVTTPADFTIETWVMPLELNRWQYITEKESRVGEIYEGTIELQTNNTFKFHIYDGVNWIATSSTTVAVIGEWYHICAVRDTTTTPKTIKLYINGIVEATTNDVTTSAITNTVLRKIGGGSRNPAGRYLNGVVSEFRMYKRALTQSEIDWNINHSVTKYVKSE